MAVKPKDELGREKSELERLLREREALEITIARTKRRIAAWAELCNENPEDLISVDIDLGGLTDACRTVLRATRKEWLTIAEIQEGLRELGFPLRDYKAPTASITTTVNRLVDADEVVVDKRPLANEYKWVGIYGAPNSLASQIARKEARRRKI